MWWYLWWLVKKKKGYKSSLKSWKHEKKTRLFIYGSRGCTGLILFKLALASLPSKCWWALSVFTATRVQVQKKSCSAVSAPNGSLYRTTYKHWLYMKACIIRLQYKCLYIKTFVKILQEFTLWMLTYPPHSWPDLWAKASHSIAMFNPAVTSHDRHNKMLHFQATHVS